jgi:hypothetical protein
MTYKITKQFIDWLGEVRPDFKLQGDKYYYQEETSHKYKGKVEKRKQDIEIVTIEEVQDRYHFSQSFVLCPVITTDTLHDILWELFDVENIQYSHCKPLSDKYIANSKDHGKFTEEHMAYEVCYYIPPTIADQLWRKYTSAKDSLWKTNPDQVLKDIMETYK